MKWKCFDLMSTNEPFDWHLWLLGHNVIKRADIILSIFLLSAQLNGQRLEDIQKMKYLTKNIFFADKMLNDIEAIEKNWLNRKNENMNSRGKLKFSRCMLLNYENYSKVAYRLCELNDPSKHFRVFGLCMYHEMLAVSTRAVCRHLSNKQCLLNTQAVWINMNL